MSSALDRLRDALLLHPSATELEVFSSFFLAVGVPASEERNPDAALHLQVPDMRHPPPHATVSLEVPGAVFWFTADGTYVGVEDYDHVQWHPADTLRNA